MSPRKILDALPPIISLSQWHYQLDLSVKAKQTFLAFDSREGSLLWLLEEDRD